MSENLLAIIPARGGSKRLPGKNIKDMHGKPLITWTIEKAGQSGVFKKIVVMTDDDKIAEVAKKSGDIETFILPPELATDTAYVGDAIKYMLDEYEKKGEVYEEFILLEPTAPGRTAEHIKDVAKMLIERIDADSVVGVTEISPNQGIHKALSIDDKQTITRATDGARLSDMKHRTQDIAPSYYINSSIYACRRSNFGKGSLWGDSTLGYVMDSKYSFDIDTPEDWELAEFKMSKLI
jgi:CMP-N-acetylneuraminic acid synthetase